jgi:hypothetical protein
MSNGDLRSEVNQWFSIFVKVLMNNFKDGQSRENFKSELLANATGRRGHPILPKVRIL